MMRRAIAWSVFHKVFGHNLMRLAETNAYFVYFDVNLSELVCVISISKMTNRFSCNRPMCLPSVFSSFRFIHTSCQEHRMRSKSGKLLTRVIKWLAPHRFPVIQQCLAVRWPNEFRFGCPPCQWWSSSYGFIASPFDERFIMCDAQRTDRPTAHFKLVRLLMVLF